MSILMPSRVLARPAVLVLRPTSRRAFSVATRSLLESGQPHHASTALKTNVRESEERSAASVQVVGDEVKGAEGPHYQGEYSLADFGR